MTHKATIGYASQWVDHLICQFNKISTKHDSDTSLLVWSARRQAREMPVGSKNVLLRNNSSLQQ